MNDSTAVIRDLGDGLILRSATVADVDALSAFDASVHSDVGWDTPDTHVGAWVRDLVTKPHPTFSVSDFLVVEDTGTGAIVSSTNLIPQTWSYDGIEFGVGRPELVGTHPDYRRRGLVRAQFEVLHRWSAERGHQVQAITGIPWYYRQFGYEMTLSLHGGRRGPASSVPALKEGEEEPYCLRTAGVADLAFIREVAAYAQQRSLVGCVRNEALWQYELEARSPESAAAQQFYVIETPDGEPVGFTAYQPTLWGSALYIGQYELKPGTSWWAVTPTVLRHLKVLGPETPPYVVREGGGPAFDSVGLSLGGDHPVYSIVADWMPWTNRSYAWYIRVPDFPAFLTTVAPVLERRLADSIMVGHTGSLVLDFYCDGVKIDLEDGRIVGVEPWTNSEERGVGKAQFPDLTFLHLLFGHRNFADLAALYADCWANREGRLLVDILFPKRASELWPIA